jgi:hypothetical protein
MCGCVAPSRSRPSELQHRLCVYKKQGFDARLSASECRGRSDLEKCGCACADVGLQHGGHVAASKVRYVTAQEAQCVGSAATEGALTLVCGLKHTAPSTRCCLVCTPLQSVCVPESFKFTSTCHHGRPEMWAHTTNIWYTPAPLRGRARRMWKHRGIHHACRVSQP